MLNYGYYNWKNKINFWIFFGGVTNKLNPWNESYQSFRLFESVLIVIGGSLSYGFFDKESDVDVYILWELPREKWFERLREYLFVHKAVDSFRIQYIPINLHNTQYSPLACLFNDNFDALSKIDDIKLLYAIQHFIPIHDTRNAVKKAQKYIYNLELNYWKDKCIEHCCKHIDVLEAFYSSLKRNNAFTGSLLYGNAIKGLLEIAYLAEGTPYPTEKWIWNGLEKVNYKLFNELRIEIANKLPETCEDMRNNVFNLASIICNTLKENNIVPVYIVDDLLHP